MWLVIASLWDEAALWAYEGLGPRAAAAGVELELVTSEALGMALRWQHFVDQEGARVVIELADGRSFDSAGRVGKAPSAVLNRLQSFPHDHLPATGPEAEYARAELQAFYASWLYGLPCPVLSPASPQGLCGRWRPRSEWFWLAGRSGFETPTLAFGSAEAVDLPTESVAPPGSAVPGSAVERVIVVGEEVVRASPGPLGRGGAVDPLPASVHESCSRLASLAENPLLGIDLDPASWQFLGADPHLDFRFGGEPFLDALGRALGRPLDAPITGRAHAARRAS